MNFKQTLVYIYTGSLYSSKISADHKVRLTSVGAKAYVHQIKSRFALELKLLP